MSSDDSKVTMRLRNRCHIPGQSSHAVCIPQRRLVSALATTDSGTVLLWNITKRLLTIILIVGSLPLGGTLSDAQSINEVLNSPEMRKLRKTRVDKTIQREAERTEPNSNFSLIWDKSSAPKLLLVWLQALSLDHRARRTSTSLEKEYAKAHTEFEPVPGALIHLDVQIPHPLYEPLVDLGAFAEFNRFRPPYLKVEVEQVLSFNGIDAHYYRTTSGRCSLLFRVARNGIVNLSTAKCVDSKLMMKIAQKLNFTELNRRLTS